MSKSNSGKAASRPPVDLGVVQDLNDATEAWFAYAKRVFGPCTVVVPACLLHKQYKGTSFKTTIRGNVRNHRRSLLAWDAFIHAFLEGRGRTYDVVTKSWA